eukprot:gb/GFBE01054223.1/.p1 GENE.gb/GFBE01054223.1/~~gb/GFBE01054223.1/.p1  ORF type:complete len:139 (+),score=29.67 gb/GFBE01054223.1/:1-417(+)
MLLGVVVSQQMCAYTYSLTFGALLAVSIFAGLELWRSRRRDASLWLCYGPLLLQQLGMMLLMLQPMKNMVVTACRIAAEPEYDGYHLMPLVERALDLVFLPMFAERLLWDYTVLGIALIACSSTLQSKARECSAEDAC